MYKITFNNLKKLRTRTFASTDSLSFQHTNQVLIDQTYFQVNISQIVLKVLPHYIYTIILHIVHYTSEEN